MRTQAERDEQTLDIAEAVLAVAVWVAVVGAAAIAGVVLDDVAPVFRALPAIAFFGFWPAVLLWRAMASQRRRSGGL